MDRAIVCICDDQGASLGDLLDCEDVHVDITRHTFLECEACDEPVCMLVFDEEDVR